MRVLTWRGWALIGAGLLLVLALACGARAATPGPFTPRQAVLVLLRDKVHPATRDGRQLWALQRSMTYRTHAGDTITVPAGMVTDLASIPAVVSPLLHPDGPYVQAALVHDFLYQTHGACLWKKHPSSCSRKLPYSRADADQVLDQAMADIGVPGWQRWAVFGGVRVGGAKGWGR